MVDKEHKIFLIGCFITVSVIAYLLNWNFDSMADTATTLVSIAVGVIYCCCISSAWESIREGTETDNR